MQYHGGRWGIGGVDSQSPIGRLMIQIWAIRVIWGLLLVVTTKDGMRSHPLVRRLRPQRRRLEYKNVLMLSVHLKIDTCIVEIYGW
jgi:hypothetical protein